MFLKYVVFQQSVLGIFEEVASNCIVGSWHSALNLGIDIKSRSSQELVLLYYKEFSAFCYIIL